jgi:hypothetical protein
LKYSCFFYGGFTSGAVRMTPLEFFGPRRFTAW